MYGVRESFANRAMLDASALQGVVCLKCYLISPDEPAVGTRGRCCGMRGGK
jgi:hypothetical protein